MARRERRPSSAKKLTGKNNRCDIVLFDGPIARTFLKKDHKSNESGEHCWEARYATGAEASMAELKNSSHYCGDDRVFLHKDVDPLAHPIQLDKSNHNLTIQIHKIDGKEKDSKNKLKDIYAIRIHLPHTN